LDRTQITDDISSHLVMGMPHLETLSLSENQGVGDVTLQLFSQAPWKRTLKKLNMAKTNVTDEGVSLGIANGAFSSSCSSSSLIIFFFFIKITFFLFLIRS
jgi:hypothetical protein